MRDPSRVSLQRPRGRGADRSAWRDWQVECLARSVGLRNRDQLRRVLAADGLPCLEDLAGWIRVLGWLVDLETSGVSLSRGALCSGQDPKSRYRTVKRLTGRAWGEVRLLGTDWLLLQFAGEIRALVPQHPLVPQQWSCSA